MLKSNRKTNGYHDRCRLFHGTPLGKCFGQQLEESDFKGKIEIHLSKNLIFILKNERPKSV